MMDSKECGGFKNKPIKCPHCGGSSIIEPLPPKSDEDVKHCPFCGNNIYSDNVLSDDELISQIEKAGDL
jgi:ribosomal protein S27AE